jgi:glutathione peroxidase|tara:strand:- start:237 stop:782 length:546 start_codon:yes stop_codon:yes gene_type:complete
MKKYLIVIIFMFGLFTKTLADTGKNAYDFSFRSINGESIDLKNYQGKILVIVNVASRCGFTNQYEDLQELWINYKEKNVIVLGVPSNSFKQELGSNEEIKTFCETNFGIDFLITEKTNVIGKNAHPFFVWAKDSFGNSAVPKWNFHKIIINKEGKVSKSFSSITRPKSKKFLNQIELEIKS